MERIEDRIFEIINGEVDCNSSLTAGLFFKLASTINALCDSMTNIGTDEFSESGIWTTPPTEICWAIAFGYGGSGGGGGGAPRLFNMGAVLGDSGSPGGSGGNTFLAGNLVALGAPGGGGGVLGGSTGPVHPICRDGEIKPLNGSSFTPGRGSFWSSKAYQTYVFDDSAGEGGHCPEFGMTVLKDLTPNTGYDVIIGAGGTGGADHPILASQLSGSGLTKRDSTSGQNGLMKIIYSGY